MIIINILINVFQQESKQILFGEHVIDYGRMDTSVGRRVFFRRFLERAIKDSKRLATLRKKEDKELITALAKAAMHLWNELSDGPMEWIQRAIYEKQLNE